LRFWWQLFNWWFYFWLLAHVPLVCFDISQEPTACIFRVSGFIQVDGCPSITAWSQFPHPLLHSDTFSPPSPPIIQSSTWTKLSHPDDGGSTLLLNIRIDHHVHIVKTKKTAIVLATAILNCIFNVPYITDILKHAMFSLDSSKRNWSEMNWLLALKISQIYCILNFQPAILVPLTVNCWTDISL
jgi:hypothetical protein